MAIETEFLDDVRTRMESAFSGIEQAVRQLDDKQLWHRPSSKSNSVGIILQHLTGNLNQWVLDALGGSGYKRNRPLEFEDKSQKAQKEMLRNFVQLGKDVQDTLAKLSPGSLLEPRRIQDTDQTVFSALMLAVTHANLHAGQILYIVKMLLNDTYVPVSRH